MTTGLDCFRSWTQQTPKQHNNRMTKAPVPASSDAFTAAFFASPPRWRDAYPFEFAGTLSLGESARANAAIGQWQGYMATPRAVLFGTTGNTGQDRYGDVVGRPGDTFRAGEA